MLQYEGRFPEKASDVPADVVDYIAQQVGIEVESVQEFQWDGRTARTHKRHIRELYGFRTITAADLDDLREWLIAEALPDEQRKSHLSEIAYERFRQQLTELIHKDPAIIDNIDDMSDDAPEPFRIHDLKTGIGATKINNIRQVAARLGYSVDELMAWFGWNSAQTAISWPHRAS